MIIYNFYSRVFIFAVFCAILETEVVWDNETIPIFKRGTHKKAPDERTVMAKFRQERINDAVASEVSSILREVKDPRVSGALITITSADVTADLKYAKIFYSSVTGEDDDIKKGLKSASGFVRSRLAKELNLRITPEISFIYDNSVEHGVEIARILGTLDISDDDGDDGDD